MPLNILFTQVMGICVMSNVESQSLDRLDASLYHI